MAKPIAQLDRLKYLLLLWSERTSENKQAVKEIIPK
jgi:rod shape-determining protein MreC